MFKSIFFSLLLLISAVNLIEAKSERPKLHAFVVGQTNDPMIGAQADFGKMQAEMKRIADIVGLDIVMHVYPKESTPPEVLAADLKGLVCGSDDMVWFYYTGHGSNAVNYNNGRFPQFIIKDKKFEQEKVHEVLLSKKPRLLITMFDCCNFRTENEAEILLFDVKRANYIALFGEATGDIKIASNTAGVQSYSWGNAVSGGIFTISFLSALEDMTSLPYGKCTWDALLAKTQSGAQELAKASGKQQTPYYEHRISRYKGNAH
jgi:Caspase domain